MTLAACVAVAYSVALIKKETRIQKGIALLTETCDAPTNCELHLIPTVNYLHGLGRNEALETLRRYALKHPSVSNKFVRELFSLDRVVPHLFIPAQRDNCPLYYDSNCIVIYNGIPFNVDAWNNPQMIANNNRSVILEWAAKNWTFRDSKITPSNNPFVAVDELVAQYIERAEMLDDEIEREWTIESSVFYRDHLNQQVFQMVKHLIPGYSEPDAGWLNAPKQWQDLRKTCKTQGLHWDAKKQAYEVNR